MRGYCFLSSTSSAKCWVKSSVPNFFRSLPRVVIDIGDIDVSIKMSCNIDIDIENVKIDILELGVTPVVELASLTTSTLKRIYLSETM